MKKVKKNKTKPNIRKNRWLKIVFGSYLFTILFFSVIYYIIYSINPSSLHISGEIRQYQFENQLGDLEKERDTLEIQRSYLEALINKLEKKPEFQKGGLFKEGTRFLFGDTIYTISSKIGSAFGSGLRYRYNIAMTNRKKEKLAETSFFSSNSIDFRSLEAGSKLIVCALNVVDSKLIKTKSTIKSLSKPHSKVLTFMDVVYFSTITQSSVGNGDILPNNTFVRIVVLLQVIIGLFIVGILINVVVKERLNK